MSCYRWKILTIGFMLLFIYVCLLLLYYPKEEYNSKVSYSNILLMESRVKNYIRYNEDLFNNTKVMTLKELYDINIVPTLINKKNEECNASASYILSEKLINNQYKLTTTLICNNSSETIVTYFN